MPEVTRIFSCPDNQRDWDTESLQTKLFVQNAKIRRDDVIQLQVRLKLLIHTVYSKRVIGIEEPDWTQQKMKESLFYGSVLRYLPLFLPSIMDTDRVLQM